MEKEDFRLFKLTRLWELADTGESFVPRDIPEERKDLESYFTEDIQITVLFDERVKYKLIDEYGVGCYTVTEEGRLLFRTSFTNKDYMISWVLGFGDKAEVLYPKSLKQEIKKIAENIMKQYQ
jgi:predicted DNA-binding transcriptional regulator YafY